MEPCSSEERVTCTIYFLKILQFGHNYVITWDVCFEKKNWAFCSEEFGLCQHFGSDGSCFLYCLIYTRTCSLLDDFAIVRKSCGIHPNSLWSWRAARISDGNSWCHLRPIKLSGCHAFEHQGWYSDWWVLHNAFKCCIPCHIASVAFPLSSCRQWLCCDPRCRCTIEWI